MNSTEDAVFKRKIKIVAEKSGISRRYSVIKDFKAEPADFEFFNKTASLLPEPLLNQRMDLYKKEILPLALKAILKIKDFDALKNTITDIITVTCTGLFAPGLDIELVRELGLNATVNRSSVNFM